MKKAAALPGLLEAVPEMVWTGNAEGRVQYALASGRIAKKIIEGHGGRIRVESALEPGAAFFFWRYQSGKMVVELRDGVQGAHAVALPVPLCSNWLLHLKGGALLYVRRRHDDLFAGRR